MSAIARSPGRAPSTVTREVAANGATRPYGASKAHCPAGTSSTLLTSTEHSDVSEWAHVLHGKGYRKGLSGPGNTNVRLDSRCLRTPLDLRF
jgi:hypothetical protein